MDGSVPTRLMYHQDNIIESRDKSAKIMYMINFMTETLIERVPTNQVISRLVYIQLRHEVITGTLNVNDETCLRLAALTFQENFGEPNERNHQVGFIPPGRMFEYISTRILSKYTPAEWEQLIFQHHTEVYKDFVRRSVEFVPQREYCKTCRESSMGMFGSKIWSVKQTTMPSMPESVLLGIHESGISVYNSKTRISLVKFELRSLSKWGFKPSSSFWFRLKPTKMKSKVQGKSQMRGSVTYSFETSRGSEISGFLTAFANVLVQTIRIQKKVKPVIKIQTIWRGYMARRMLDAKIDAIEFRLRLAVMAAVEEKEKKM